MGRNKLYTGPPSPVGEVFCNKCEMFKPVECFQPKASGKVFSPCKECDRLRKKERYQNNKEHVNALSKLWVENNRDRSREAKWAGKLRRFGFSVDEYQVLWSSQNGKCAVCLQEGVPRKGDLKPLHLDHDHRCCPQDRACPSCIRGLLCFGCNKMLGFFNDDVDLMWKAVLYLAFPRAYEDNCSICGIFSADLGEKLCEDHDHLCCAGRRRCGRCTRGLLCRRCNMGVGAAKDTPSVVLKGIYYLESFKVVTSV